MREGNQLAWTYYNHMKKNTNSISLNSLYFPEHIREHDGKQNTKKKMDKQLLSRTYQRRTQTLFH